MAYLVHLISIEKIARGFAQAIFSLIQLPDLFEVDQDQILFAVIEGVEVIFIREG